MKIYAGNRDDEVSLEYSEVDLLCTKQALDMMINLLLQFQKQINHYLSQNKNAELSGFTHMHYQDNNAIWNENDADVVFYVDLSKTQGD